MDHHLSSIRQARHFHTGTVLGMVMMLILLGGCGGEKKPAPPEDSGIAKTYERGPVTLELQTGKADLTTAETLDLTLTVTAEDGYSVEFPTYPVAEKTAPPSVDDENTDSTTIAPPSSFTPIGYEDLPPDLQPDGRVSRSRIYHLEPFLEGTYEIAPLSVTFGKAQDGENQKNTVETEPLSITVTSVMAPGDSPELKDIAGPLSLRDPAPWGRYLLMAAFLAVIAGAGYWYFFRYTPPGPPPAPPIPPHQRALDALEAIRRLHLVEQGQYKEYYIRVSDVLRRYMEEQFQLRAPERTTEEFLDDLQHNAILGLQEQLLLREFLRHCDMVKFARAEPSPEQIQETMETCERFIVDSNAAFQAAQKASEAAMAPEA